MRRSVRVGLYAGAPLEEFGVSPDVRHFMTRRDLLDENSDLLAAAARIIKQRPIFRLSVKPYSRSDVRRVVLGADSKLPSPGAGSPIARLDVYVNDRPLRSIDATRGAVRSKHVTIGKTGNRPAKVEIEALDGTGAVVASRRMLI